MWSRMQYGGSTPMEEVTRKLLYEMIYITISSLPKGGWDIGVHFVSWATYSYGSCYSNSYHGNDQFSWRDTLEGGGSPIVGYPRVTGSRWRREGQNVSGCALACVNVIVYVCPTLGHKLLLNSWANFLHTWWEGTPCKVNPCTSQTSETKYQVQWSKVKSSAKQVFVITPMVNIELTSNLHRYNWNVK